MTAITLMASMLSVVIIMTMMWGFRLSLAKRSNKAAHFLAWALLLLSVKYITRGLTWDVAFPILDWTGHDHMTAWMRAHHAGINLIFPLVVIVAGTCGHLSLYHSIPAGERRRWSRWTAWLYPSGRRGD